MTRRWEFSIVYHAEAIGEPTPRPYTPNVQCVPLTGLDSQAMDSSQRERISRAQSAGNLDPGPAPRVLDLQDLPPTATTTPSRTTG